MPPIFSAYTQVTDIPENSAGTPGLWNSRFSVLWQDFSQLQSDVSNLVSAGTYLSTNSLYPESGNTVNVFASGLSAIVSTPDQPYVTTASALTTIGTLIAGAVPASLVTAGTFGAGDYVFPSDLTVTDTLVVGTDLASVSGYRAQFANSVGGNGKIEFFDPASPGARVQLTTYATGVSTGPSIVAQKARGTLASPLIINAADTQLLRIRASGYAPAGGFSTGGGSIYIQSGAAWTDGSSYPVYIAFRNILSGATSEAERWRITHTDGSWIPAADNTYDAASTSARIRAIYGYTGNFATRVTSPLLGTTTAVDVVFDRNSVTQLTLGSLLATFAGAMTAAATTDSTSGSTGAIYTAGGLGVTKKIFCGTEIEIDGALNHDGTTVGFYGVAPTTRQVLATGAGATVDNVITALQTLGLVSQT